MRDFHALTDEHYAIPGYPDYARRNSQIKYGAPKKVAINPAGI
jgi:hypothetical protein